jgi:hypothetical protein
MLFSQANSKLGARGELLVNNEDVRPKSDQPATTIAVRRPWEAAGAVTLALLLLINESLQMSVGPQWGFMFITLRAIVIPGASLVVATSSIVRLPFCRGRAALIRGGSALVCVGILYASWIYQWPLFSGR